MIAFIDDHRGEYGVEPICRVLKIAPSTFHAHAARRRRPETAPPRVQRDEALKPHILRVFSENFEVYGVRKVWRQLLREGFEIARCTVSRLMKALGLKGVIRGKPHRTTFSDKSAPCPLDRVNRQFHASRPNVLWVSDFTYVATWSGFVYVAFVIDVYARRIVGWRVSRSAHAGFVLDALEQALHDRRPLVGGGLVHHSDRGSQYVSIKYTERLAKAGLEPSVGSVGDSYDNALAETINGLYKAEVIWRKGPWRSLDQVEYATLEWVVQQSPAARAHRQHPARRGRGRLLCGAGGNSYRRVTKTKQPPGLPGRFIVTARVVRTRFHADAYQYWHKDAEMAPTDCPPQKVGVGWRSLKVELHINAVGPRRSVGKGLVAGQIRRPECVGRDAGGLFLVRQVTHPGGD